MPIRPELRKFYRGKQWEATRLRILTRAGNKCEQCHAPNATVIYRGKGGHWCRRPGLYRWISPWGYRLPHGTITHFHAVLIVLTIAHLNHIPGDDRDENLLALCQWCHLNYDKLHHKETRSERKDAARPLLDLAREFGANFEALAQRGDR